MEKTWRDVLGFEGIYMVSNFGEVKALAKERTLFHGGKYIIPEHFMNQFITPYGYHGYRLSKDRKDFYVFKHRLMMQAFVPNPENKPSVNHINSVRTDNRLENLEWCTALENNIHAYKNGKIGAYKNKFGKDHNQSIPIIAIKQTAIIEFENLTRASEYFKCTVQAVWNCLNGKSKTCKGHELYLL